MWNCPYREMDKRIDHVMKWMAHLPISMDKFMYENRTFVHEIYFIKIWLLGLLNNTIWGLIAVS